MLIVLIVLIVLTARTASTVDSERVAPHVPRPMPIFSGSVTFASYRVEHHDEPPADFRHWLSGCLKPRAFKPIDKAGDDERSAGFVETQDHDATELAPASLFEGEYALMSWRIDTLKVSARDIKTELESWAATFEAEQGRLPSKSEKVAHRVALRQLLRSKAEPASKVYDISWGLRDQKLLIWTAARRTVDQIIEALETTLKVRLHPPTPSAVARREQIADHFLVPTPDLVGLALEVAHVEE